MKNRLELAYQLMKEEGTIALYVDNNEILQAREGLFRNGDELIKQFKRGNYAFTRFQNNKKQLVENKISLNGFTDAFNDMEAQFSNLGNERNLSF